MTEESPYVRACREHRDVQPDQTRRDNWQKFAEATKFMEVGDIATVISGPGKGITGAIVAIKGNIITLQRQGGGTADYHRDQIAIGNQPAHGR